MALDVSATDLGVFLGAGDNFDEDRADYLIGLAQGLCESVVSPLPDTAAAVVIAVAARAYSNPQALTQQTMGPYQGAMPGGLYLTRSDKATLRRFGGRSGAFSIDMLPPGAGQHLPPWDAVYSPDDAEDSSSS